MTVSLKTVLMLAAAGFIYYEYHKAQAAIVETVSTTLNPASDKNFIYAGTQNIGHELGAWAYNIAH